MKYLSDDEVTYFSTRAICFRKDIFLSPEENTKVNYRSCLILVISS